MDDFSRIVELRQRRLDRARRIESEEHAALNQAKAARADAEREIADYLSSIRTLEADLLTELLHKAVSVKDLLAVEEALKKVQQKAEKLADHRSECETRVVEAEERTRIAARDRAERARKLNKSELIQQRMESLQAQQDLAREESAIDEYCEQMTARTRDGGHGA